MAATPVAGSRAPTPGERRVLQRGLGATPVPPDQVEHLVGAARVLDVVPGTLLLEQGDMGDDLLVVLDGIVEVRRSGRLVAHPGPGTVLGEHGARHLGPRTAAVTAVTRGRVAVLPGRAVRLAMRRAPVAEELLEDVGRGREVA